MTKAIVPATNAGSLVIEDTISAVVAGSPIAEATISTVCSSDL